MNFFALGRIYENMLDIILNFRKVFSDYLKTHSDIGNLIV